MSVPVSAIVRPTAIKGANALSKLFITACGRLTRYFARRTAVADLCEADEAALRDIGLTRSQIRGAVHGRITHLVRERM